MLIFGTDTTCDEAVLVVGFSSVFNSETLFGLHRLEVRVWILWRGHESLGHLLFGDFGLLGLGEMYKNLTSYCWTQQTCNNEQGSYQETSRLRFRVCTLRFAMPFSLFVSHVSAVCYLVLEEFFLLAYKSKFF